MIVEYDDVTNKWIVTAGVRDTERMRSIPGARAKRKAEPGVAVWRVPATIEAAKQMKFSLPEAEWTSEAKARRAVLARERKARLSAMKGKEPGAVFSGPGIDKRLSTLQNRGVKWLLSGSGILADDMGSGKTVMACVAANASWFRTVLLITTKSTIGVWADHLREWTDIEPFIFHGTKGQQEKAWQAFTEHEGRKALLTTHALSGTHSKQASFGNVAAEGEDGRFNEPYDLCIIDEAHKMGVNPRNKWVRSMWAIGANSDTRWALTGTPVNDNPEDLWVLMRFTNPDVLGKHRGAFRDRYCIMRDEFHGGRTNEGIHPDRSDEFQWVIKPYMMRRLKREVVKGLPDALPTQYITLPMTNKQKKAYNAMVKEMMTVAEDGGLLVSPDGLSQAQSCEYIADGLPILDEDGKVTALDHDISSSNKMSYVLDVAEQRNGDPFVLYAFSRKTTDMLITGLEEKGYKVGSITGATAQGDRDTYVSLFQKGKLDAIVINDAAAEGITLTAADLIVFVRESWRAPINQQVKDRIDRWGQERPPHTVVLMSEGTVDETRRAAVEGKVTMQEEVLQDKKRAKALLTGTLPITEEF